jgi:hypothetical protein
MEEFAGTTLLVPYSFLSRGGVTHWRDVGALGRRMGKVLVLSGGGYRMDCPHHTSRFHCPSPLIPHQRNARATIKGQAMELNRTRTSTLGLRHTPRGSSTAWLSVPSPVRCPVPRQRPPCELRLRRRSNFSTEIANPGGRNKTGESCLIFGKSEVFSGTFELSTLSGG